MPAMGSNNDEWVASVLSYLRYELGVPQQYANMIPPKFLPQILVSPDEIKKVREATAGRNKPWTKRRIGKRKKIVKAQGTSYKLQGTRTKIQEPNKL
jgi:hypothetical protein